MDSWLDWAVGSAQYQSANRNGNKTQPTASVASILGRIKRMLKRRIIWIAVALSVFAVTSYFSYRTYTQVRRARMASQCAVLTYDLGNHLAERHEAGLPSDASEYLARYSTPGSLFHRDASGQLVDSWDHPFVVTQFVQSGRSILRVTSTGRDGMLGTPDDFSREMGWDLK
jgi:hypothetical protein